MDQWSGGSPRITGTDYEFQAVNCNGIPSGLCLADTTTGTAYLATCGANGTIWVVVQSGNGYYLYDRYLTNQGHNYVLAVDMPTGNSPVQLTYQPGLAAGDGWYARWIVG